MIKRTPTVGQLTAMVVFALSCFSLVLFLWIAFGGSVPLKPQGYRIHASFDEAVQLATEAEVRISGVPIGKVKAVEPSEGRTKATLQIDPRFAPLPADIRATLRIKTLLGETYIELTPGTKGGPTIPENGTLPVEGHVSQMVELDEVIRTFDVSTRAAFGNWLVGQSDAMKGRGDELNQAFGVLPVFFADGNDLLSVMRKQDAAVGRLFGNTADIFEAFDSRPGQLTELIEAFNRLLRVTANRGEQFADTFREFPEFLRQTRKMVKRFSKFSDRTEPLVDNVTEFAEESSDLMKPASKVTADARALITNLEPLLDRADSGLPASDEFFKLAQPTVAQLDPFLRQLNPILEYIGQYQKEITGFFANDAAASQAQFTDKSKKRQNGHYLRAMVTLTPESLAYMDQRTTGSRANAYPAPDAFSVDKLAAGLQVFDASQCGTIAMPKLQPNTTTEYDAAPDLVPIIDTIKNIVYGGDDAAPYPAPACTEQPPQTFSGESGKFPHVRQRATP